MLTRGSLCLGVAGAVACGGPGGAPVEPPSPPPISVANVIEWALGSGSRADPPEVSDAILCVRDNPDAQTKPPEPDSCEKPRRVPATSILPGPPTLRWLFLLINGGLHVLRQPKEPSAMVEPVLGSEPVPRITRLLAYRQDAGSTVGAPLQILAVVKPEGALEELWSLTVADRTGEPEAAILRAEPVKSGSAFTSQRAFFGAYNSPRCMRGGLKCVAIADNRRDWFIEVESERGALPSTYLPLGRRRALDVAWSSAVDDSSLYVLIEGPLAPVTRPSAE